MSMISDLVIRLRIESKAMRRYGVDYMATLLMQASDTIRILSEKARADRPRGEWIPVNERLPEPEEDVLVWLPSRWNKNGGTVEIGFLDEDNKWNWLAESMSGYYEIVDHVSAWMPLPEPYREEGDR